MWYDFSQTGGFIDFLDPDCDTLGCPIYQDALYSDGWSWVGQVFAGVQWAPGTQWVVTAEGRYSHADAELDRSSYGGFEPIDLSGFQFMLGFGVRF